ncbi:DNA repair and recombination protein RadA [Candidatus Woesearchaeota archaeon]|nr:DNA repair and recombination protein RadA [Candidatus Woesearchaeota archaeon]
MKPNIKEQSVEEQSSSKTKDVSSNTGVKEVTLHDLPGVGAATAEKLEMAGYSDMMGVAVATSGELVESGGVTEATARKIINAARSALDMGFESGQDFLKKREDVIKLKLKSEAINELMGGGFETGAITECFGEYGSGKTQIGHALAVMCQKQDPDAVAVYIDTEGTFRPERIVQFAQGAGLDVEKTLKQIRVAKAYNSDHQMLLVEKVGDMIKKDGLKIQVVIVDSLTSHFRAEFIGRGTLAERQQKLNKHMHALLKLADMNNICVYVTNQVQADPAQFFGDPTKAVGGHIVAHASTFRIYLRKGKKGTRVAKLIDAPNLAESEAAFVIAEDGIKDL